MKTDCQVILTSKIVKSKQKELEKFLIENLPNVRNFEGCSTVDVYIDDESKEMIFNEEWQSKEDHEKYMIFISNNGVMTQLISFLEGAPKVKYYQKLNV
jgi:quinol monooxygenase YgiN